MFVLMISALRGRDARAARSKQERGENITALFEQYGTKAWPAVAEKVASLLKMEPVGYFAGLAGPGGCFRRAESALTNCLQSPTDFTFVEWYFHCFSFPAGTQGDVLQWCARMLESSLDDPSRLQHCLRVANLIIAAGGSAEVQWLYHEALEHVRRTNGSPAAKSAALHLGRRSYSFLRPGRVPTVYDEQAIANDIASSATSK